MDEIVIYNDLTAFLLFSKWLSIVIGQIYLKADSQHDTRSTHKVRAMYKDRRLRVQTVDNGVLEFVSVSKR